MPNGWITASVFMLLIGGSIGGYFYGRHVCSLAHEAALTKARAAFEAADAERQAIEDQRNKLAQQLEDQANAEPVSAPAALPLSRVLRIDKR